MNRRHFLTTLSAAATAPLLAAPALAHHWTDIPYRLGVTPGLRILTAALQATSQFEALKARDRRFTLFAPTDEAFRRLPARTLNSLFEPANRAQLEAILSYHIANGAIDSGQITGRRVNLRMSDGNLVQADGTRSPVRLNRSANVIAADSEGRNGIIHVIDAVLMPS